ncbi:hypothetical protein EXS71_01580 [Candidatus Uhrbacteria bacterium]|nr:hypothetical protein [Candidatus Uhrbacteria bacterium]
MHKTISRLIQVTKAYSLIHSLMEDGGMTRRARRDEEFSEATFMEASMTHGSCCTISHKREKNDLSLRWGIFLDQDVGIGVRTPTVIAFASIGRNFNPRIKIEIIANPVHGWRVNPVQMAQDPQEHNVVHELQKLYHRLPKGPLNAVQATPAIQDMINLYKRLRAV